MRYIRIPLEIATVSSRCASSIFFRMRDAMRELLETAL
jgi:hypothetical protein